MADTLYTLASESDIIFKERGSKFIAYAFKAESLAEVKEQLKSLKEKYPDASHHCYAYILQDPDKGSGFADAGEPANSAGRPILRQLISGKLRNAHVVVLRYFGGTKLGVPGLIEAYGEAASEAINKAGVTIYIPSETWQIESDYANENLAYRLIRQNGGTVLGRDTADTCRIVFRIASENAENLKGICSEIPNFDISRLT